MLGLLLVLGLCPGPSLPLPPAPYKNVSLATGCGLGGTKQNFHLNKGAIVFNFNSSEHNFMGLDCHLEVHVHSRALGISVFIDTLEINRSPGCISDYLQFGRDKVFITTYTSDKYCDLYEPVTSNIHPEDGHVVSYNYGNKVYRQREYVEEKDIEMDIWLKVAPARVSKEIQLVVAPFKKNCQDDDYYRRCHNSDRCFKSQLFCEGVVKCTVFTEEETDRFCPGKSNPGSFLYLPVIIIIIVFSIIAISFLSFGVKMLLKHFTKDRQAQASCSDSVTFRNSVGPRVPGVAGSSVRIGSSLSNAEREALRTQEDEIPPDLPTQPPPYSEVVGVGYKDDPPKYDDLIEQPSQS